MCGALQSQLLADWLQAVGAMGVLFLTLWLLWTGHVEKREARVVGVYFVARHGEPPVASDPHHEQLKETAKPWGSIDVYNWSDGVIRDLNTVVFDAQGKIFWSKAHDRILVQPKIMTEWGTQKQSRRQTTYLRGDTKEWWPADRTIFVFFTDQFGRRWRLSEGGDLSVRYWWQRQYR